MSGTTASWFGRPQAIKKAAGNAAKRGTNASNTLRIIPSGTTLFRQSGMPWVPFTYCEKRSGPTRSKFDALPLHRRSNRRITRDSPTGRRGYDQTTTGVSNPRKSRGPTLCLCSTHWTPLRRVELILAIHAYAAIRRSAH